MNALKGRLLRAAALAGAWAAAAGCSWNPALKPLGEDDGAGSSEQNTQWGARGAEGACAWYEREGARKPVYLRLVRSEDFEYAGEDPDQKVWDLFEKIDSDGRLKSYGLTRLDLLLVWGDPLGSEGCVLDVLPASSGIPKYGAECAAELQRLQARVSQGQMLSAFDRTVWELCRQQNERSLADPDQFVMGRVQLQHDARFTTFAEGTPGSEAPIPEGVYRIGAERWMQGWENWLGRVYPEPLGPVAWNLDAHAYRSGRGEAPAPSMVGRRGLFRLHVDVNQAVVPGTAGCVGVTPGNIGKLLCWMRKVRPEIMVVDYKKGTVNAQPEMLLDSSRIMDTGDGAFTGFPSAYECRVASDFPAVPQCNWWDTEPPCSGDSSSCRAVREQWERERCR